MSDFGLGLKDELEIACLEHTQPEEDRVVFAVLTEALGKPFPCLPCQHSFLRKPALLGTLQTHALLSRLLFSGDVGLASTADPGVLGMEIFLAWLLLLFSAALRVGLQSHNDGLKKKIKNNNKKKV